MPAPVGYQVTLGGASGGGGGGGVTMPQVDSNVQNAIDNADEVRTVANQASLDALVPSEGWIAKRADDKSTWKYADGVWNLIGFYELPIVSGANHSYEVRPDNTAWAPLNATGANGDTITAAYPDGRLIGWKKSGGVWAQSALQTPSSGGIVSLLPVRVTATQPLADGQGYRVITPGLTLTAPSSGAEFTVANDSGGSLRIAAPAGFTVDGQTDFVEFAANGVATFSLNGTDWEITEWGAGGGGAETPIFDTRITTPQTLSAGTGNYVTVTGLTLTAPASGDEFTVANTSGGTLRIAPSAGQTISGEADYIEFASNGCATFRRNGTNWEVIEWGVPGGLEFYNSPLAQPPTPRAAGAQWLTSDTNDFFVWNGTAFIDTN